MNLPSQYPVIKMFGSGGPEVLKMSDQKLHLPQENQVLIEVRAFGLNRPDIFQRKGHYAAPIGIPQDIPGLEVSGVVVACGAKVKRFHTGDAVCALLAGGGYAAYCLVEEEHCLPLQQDRHGLSFEQGAAIPETLFTVWHNVFQAGALQKNQNFLIHGGSGGIGTMGIKLAAYKGAHVYATAGSDQRVEACKKLGASYCLNYKVQDFEKEWSSVKFDVILDCVGGDYFEKNLNLLAQDGRLVQINAIGGKKVSLDLMKLMVNRWQITGSTLRPRSSAFKSALRHQIETEIWADFFLPHSPLLPQIDRILPAKDIQEAHYALENGDIFGKIVLKW